MKNFRNLLTFSFLAIGLSLFLGACQKNSDDDVTPTDTTQPTNNNQITITRSVEGGLDELCFDLVYPVSVNLPDGSVETANSDADLEAIFENYFANNPTATDGPMLQFPLNIIDEIGEELTLENEEELAFMVDMCAPWEECFSLNYPLTVIFPDGTSQQVNSNQALTAAFGDWHVANPNVDEEPVVVFPIGVTTVDGDVITVADEDELDDLFEDCFGDEWGDGDWNLCFDLIFPITVNLPDGTTETANNLVELDGIFTTYMENTPGATEFPTIDYPIEAEMDGTTVTLFSDADFEDLVEACFEMEDDWNDCFSFNYPLTIVFPDGSTAEVSSDQELETVVDAWYAANPNSDEDPTLQYPVDVTTVDGEVLTINSDEELEALFEDCFECLVVNGGGLAIDSKEATATAFVVKLHPAVKAAKQQRTAQVFAQRK